MAALNASEKAETAALTMFQHYSGGGNLAPVSYTVGVLLGRIKPPAMGLLENLTNGP